MLTFSIKAETVNWDYRIAWICVCLGMIGCQSQSREPKADVAQGDGSSSQATAPASSRLKVEIQLNWKPEAEHGGYYAALVHGFYADEGLDVQLLPGGPATPLMESLATNRMSFGVDNADKLLRARAEEADVVAVFAPIQDSPRCILVHAESGIKRITDLGSVPGMTLGWNTSQPFAQYLSKKLDLSQLQMTKYAGVGPFLLDKKYAMQAYNISEPFLAKQQGADPVVLMLSELGFNTYTSLLLTNSQTISENPELVRKVIRASQRGWSRYLTNPEETNQRIAELNPEMSVEVLSFGAEQLKSLCHFGPETQQALAEQSIGRMDSHRWQELVSQLEAIEMIKPGESPAENAFTNGFLPSEK